MHELSLCTSIAKIVERTAAGRTVQRVRVDIGHLRQVVPETLAYSWEMVVWGTPLEAAKLEIRYVPAVIECLACGHHTELDEPVFRCAKCDSVETQVISGNELIVTSLDVIAARP
jgi:hydrogenase nickel incorporation protein HypA/HybF